MEDTNIGKINVEIEGTSPLLMNRFDIEAYEKQRGNKRIIKDFKPEDEAKISAYWSSGKKKELIIPAIVLYSSILNASSFYKINKRSAKTTLAGSIRVEPEEIPLGTDKYVIDTRAVVIQRNRILKSRARLDKWKASFKIVYSKNMLSQAVLEDVKHILIEAGRRIGIMDFRPQKGGYFGTFEVTKFEYD